MEIGTLCLTPYSWKNHQPHVQSSSLRLLDTLLPLHILGLLLGLHLSGNAARNLVLDESFQVLPCDDHDIPLFLIQVPISFPLGLVYDQPLQIPGNLP